LIIKKGLQFEASGHPTSGQPCADVVSNYSVIFYCAACCSSCSFLSLQYT